MDIQYTFMKRLRHLLWRKLEPEDKRD